jgi:hypothetical protein
MKTAFAIFFSALLLIGQTVVIPAQPLIQRECARCDCGGKCCVTQSRPAPRPAPAAPAHNVSPKQSQIATTPAAQIYSLPESPTPISFASISIPKSQAVPLYDRNCAYLI